MPEMALGMPYSLRAFVSQITCETSTRQFTTFASSAKFYPTVMLLKYIWSSKK